jgi:hypothetical protein
MLLALARRTRGAVLVALGVACAAGVVRAGQDSPHPAGLLSDPRTDEEMARVGAAVAALRGRAFERAVPFRTMPCALASARLLEIARLEGARCSTDVERAVVTLGFIEPDPSVTPSPQIGGRSRRDDDESGTCGLAFYDQIRKEVIVVDGRSSVDERAEVLAHELSHALQDQLFDLRARLRAIPRTASGDHDAEELAANASVNEGEATTIELLYLWERGDERSWIQGVALLDPLAQAAAIDGAGLGLRCHDRSASGMRSIGRGAAKAWGEQRRVGARAYYHALARFQYLVGATFVSEAYARGGWPLIDRIRSHPPTTTAELIHPERYFDHVAPPDRVVASDLGKRAPFRLLYENRLGELGSEVVTESDSSSWAGDDYRVFARTTDGETILEARSVWRDAPSAARFQAAVPRWLRTVKVGGSSFDLLERRGRAVVLAAGLRQGELSDARRALWSSDDAIGAIGAATGKPRAGAAPIEDVTLLLRHRGADGAPDGELRLLEASERARMSEVLKAHLDAKRPGTLETDGSSYGLRARPGGGVSWAEERADGRFIIATGVDRTAIKALRDGAERLAPLETRAPPPWREEP